MLYVCPTPIGNLGDVTLRVLEVLKQVDLVACEDTRRTRVLLDRYEISARVISFHGHNEEERVAALMPRLLAGERVALVSDAGMPALSDPGFSLVRACVAAGVPVTVLPGPSAVSTALVISGLPADRFAFVGFLERSKTKLLEQLRRLDGTGASLVAFESPHRVKASLGVLASEWPERQIALCRELTKIHEEVLRGTPLEVMEQLDARGDRVRGEVVLVLEPTSSQAIGPGGEDAADTSGAVSREVERRAFEALARLAGLGVGTKQAAAVVAGLTGLSPRQAYRLALRVREGGALLE